MLKINVKNRSNDGPFSGYDIKDDGAIVRNGFTILSPRKTRMYGGRVATAMFNDSKRTRGILKNAGFNPAEA